MHSRYITIFVIVAISFTTSFIGIAVTDIVMEDIIMSEIKQWDAFGDTRTLLYEDGAISLRCLFRNATIPCTSTYDYHLVDPNNKIVATNTCTSGGNAWFYDVKARNLAFGTYKCQYKSDTKKTSWTTEVGYKICSDDSDACTESPQCTDENKFCVITEKSTKTCSVPNTSDCVHHNTGTHLWLCGHLSLCEVLATNTGQYEISHSLYKEKDEGCKQYPNRPSRLFDGVPYNAPVAVYGSQPNLNYSCYHKIVYPLPFLCVIKRADGGIAQIFNDTCKGAVSINLNNQIVTAGTQIYKSNCELNDGQWAVSRLSNILVFFASDLVVTVEWTNTVRNLSCTPNPPVAAGFRIRYWWTSNKTDNDATVYEGESLIAERNLIYQCHAMITYKSCAPHRLFIYNISSSKVTPFNKTQNLTGTHGSANSAGVILVIPWMCVISTVAVVCVISSKSSSSIQCPD